MARRKLQNARALITGASSGIGRELARKLSQAGAKIVVTARRESRLRELVEELQAAGATAFALAGDITLPGFRTELLQFTREQLGGLDLLVNNAGAGAIGRFLESTPDTLRRIMELDFFAPVELIREALPQLQAGQKPMIVNVSSVLGHRAVPKKSEYCAAKFALHGMSDALRAEFTPLGIDVLLVSPSTTESEFFDVAAGDKAQLPWLKIRGMSSAAVARAALKAIRAGRHEIVLSPGGKLLVWFDRLCPPLVNRLVAKWG
ncbi:MAG TPA: SDR family NAD(P)-dependent oxidoreductase [Pirellulaceae bacterium]|nr:SDR family NAD(P)-dependent oxidoreductase [Pirellulaceae bacterium]